MLRFDTFWHALVLISLSACSSELAEREAMRAEHEGPTFSFVHCVRSDAPCNAAQEELLTALGDAYARGEPVRIELSHSVGPGMTREATAFVHEDGAITVFDHIVCDHGDEGGRCGADAIRDEMPRSYLEVHRAFPASFGADSPGTVFLVGWDGAPPAIATSVYAAPWGPPFHPDGPFERVGDVP